MSLEARGLTFAYAEDAAPAVSGVDLELETGELIAVVGPNGSGKSTLLALLAGWRRPQVGEVLLDGRPLGSLSHRERALQVAYLPQSVVPLYDLTVGEVVASGRHPHRGPWGLGNGGDRAAIAGALAATATTQLAARDFGSLSGGEQQRVLVASVFAQQPRWLLLDEPTASLDVHHRVAVLDVLRSAVRRGSGVILVTHDLNLAALFADRVVLLVEGRRHAVGTPTEVLVQPVLEAAYGPELIVVEHPEVARPVVLPRSGLSR